MKITKELFDELSSLSVSIMSEQGLELPNPVPKLVNTGLKRPLTLQEQIKRVMRTELSRQAQEQGYESLEEAEDFDVDDEFDVNEPSTRYLIVEEENLIPAEEFAKTLVKNQEKNKSGENASADQSADDASPKGQKPDAGVASSGD